MSLTFYEHSRLEAAMRSSQRRSPILIVGTTRKADFKSKGVSLQSVPYERNVNGWEISSGNIADAVERALAQPIED